MLSRTIVVMRLLLFINSLLMAGCSLHNKNSLHQPYSTVMVVSVSSDGNYAVSSDTLKRLILWDIRHQIAKVMANNVNIYSAYFIKDIHQFMFQDDKSNQVIIENTAGKVIKTFNPGFTTYGQIITKDLKRYFASDEEWNLFYHTENQQQKIAQGFLSFLGIGKLLNLTLSINENYLLVSGDGGDAYEHVPLSKPDGKVNLNGVVLWNLRSVEPIYKLRGNQAKTIAALSPDEKYIISGDEGGSGYVFFAKTGKKLFRMADLIDGNCVKTGKEDGDYKCDNSGMLPVPANFKNTLINSFSDLIFSIKFIDNIHYLRFTTEIPYAILYNVHDPKPLKYFPLGTDPYPMINEYSADEAIDTAPAAHILVMGQSAKGSGIIVYRYDPKNQTLTKIWAPAGP